MQVLRAQRNSIDVAKAKTCQDDLLSFLNSITIFNMGLLELVSGSARVYMMRPER